MKNKNIIKKYYKTLFWKGKNAFARAADFIAFRIIAFILLYIRFAAVLENPVLKIILPTLSLAILSLIAELFKAIRFEQFCIHEKERIRTAVFAERLLFLPEADIMHLLSGDAKLSKKHDKIFIIQKAAPVTVDDILIPCRKSTQSGLKSIALFCTAALTKEAELFIKKQAEFLSVQIITPDDISDFKEETVCDSDIESFILTQHTQTKQERRQAFSAPFRHGSALKYFTVAILLCIASFFVRYPLYYRFVAVLSSSFGFAAMYFSKKKDA